MGASSLLLLVVVEKMVRHPVARTSRLPYHSSAAEAGSRFFGFPVFASLGGHMVRVLLLSTAFVVHVHGQQVPVVQSDKPLWAKGKEWRVEARPLVDIGAVEAEPMYEFSDVIGVLRLGDGRVAVANMASGEIRFYDRTGKFLHAAGRKGAGPGEF